MRDRKLLRRWFKCLACRRWTEAEFRVYDCPECSSSRMVERVRPIEMPPPVVEVTEVVDLTPEVLHVNLGEGRLILTSKGPDHRLSLDGNDISDMVTGVAIAIESPSHLAQAVVTLSPWRKS